MKEVNHSSFKIDFICVVRKNYVVEFDLYIVLHIFQVTCIKHKYTLLKQKYIPERKYQRCTYVFGKYDWFVPIPFKMVSLIYLSISALGFFKSLCHASPLSFYVCNQIFKILIIKLIPRALQQC